MNQLKPQTPDSRTQDREHEIRLIQRRMDRKNRWQWWNAVAVIILLLVTIIVLSFPQQDHISPLWSQLPLYVRGLLGLLLLLSIYTLYQQHLLKLLRNQIRPRIDNLYELAVLDPLTGLYNRRFVEDRLRTEIARADRYGEPLMVLVSDLDDLKGINDRLGHAAGDLVLTEIAHRIRKAVRASDFAVRMGGDEFLVLLPGCPPEKVKVVLARLAPFEMDFEGEKINVSASSGYTQYQTGESVEQLLGRADQSLYAAKAARPARAQGAKKVPANDGALLPSP